MDRNIDNNVDNNIIQTEYSELMQKSYIDYAMSVIIARALPDVRDGLKPVQRRTLYDMHELGIRYDKPYRKSARIVGDTMGKYHPHGDSSIYDAMVVLAQDFKKGMPLIDGHGNFGSIEGDGAAAMRYTEARLQKITQEAYLADLDKNVVDFIPNYDETEKEPEVLPVTRGVRDAVARPGGCRAREVMARRLPYAPRGCAPPSSSELVSRSDLPFVSGAMNADSTRPRITRPAAISMVGPMP